MKTACKCGTYNGYQATTSQAGKYVCLGCGEPRRRVPSQKWKVGNDGKRRPVRQ